MPVALFVTTRGAYGIDVVSSDSLLRDFVTLDSERYLAAARSIVDSPPLGQGDVFHFAPLYPYFLAAVLAFGGRLWAVYAAQIGLAALAAWLVFRIGLACFGKAVGVVAASIWILYGGAAMLELKIMETSLATALMMGAVFFSLPSRSTPGRLLLAGALLGAACLARPNTLILAPLLLAWHGTRGTWRFSRARRNLGRSALILSGIAISLGPMAVRNRVAAGEWMLISGQGGVAFAQGNNPRSEGTYAKVEGFSGDPLQQAAEAERIAETAVGRSLTASEVDGYFYGQGWDFLAAEPLRAARLAAEKLVLWFGSEELSIEYVLAAERELFPSLWLVPVPFGVLLGLSVLGFRSRFLAGKPALLLTVLAANLASALLFFFASRYRVPAVPCLCVLAAVGVVRLCREIAARRLFLAVAVAVGSLLATSPVYELQQATYFGLLGRAYLAAGDARGALRYLEPAAARNPVSWPIHHNLGEAYGTLGRYPDAVRELSIAAELEPNAASTRRALAHYRARL